MKFQNTNDKEKKIPKASERKHHLQRNKKKQTVTTTQGAERKWNKTFKTKYRMVFDLNSIPDKMS